jgi:hypothetical protein
MSPDEAEQYPIKMHLVGIYFTTQKMWITDTDGKEVSIVPGTMIKYVGHKRLPVKGDD